MSERLDAAVLRVNRARKVVERQRAHVEQLRSAGKYVATSEDLLETYIKTLALFEEHERFLRDEPLDAGARPLYPLRNTLSLLPEDQQ
ncbi:hypothetical protein [Methylocystis parvus]|uniref:Uncharacterized protein n=1 Tax=Methylocystis parvus TaxID=134 RepID=A0A6B8LV04_9HYPH|nr:hypothetical protein [Methylocystis parvus]QGM96197.1 hypothetical protein F7D14_00955 [Methylocystis parvus]WBJ99976.1 hypothetical protein MMG94_18660 [Methylocystis parvus OBBP]